MGPIPTISLALVGFNEDNASNSEILMSVRAEFGTGGSPRDGIVNGLWVKTEWKNELNRDAFSSSEVAICESRWTVEGIVISLVKQWMYLKITEVLVLDDVAISIGGFG